MSSHRPAEIATLNQSSLKNVSRKQAKYLKQLKEQINGSALETPALNQQPQTSQWSAKNYGSVNIKNMQTTINNSQPAVSKFEQKIARGEQLSDVLKNLSKNASNRNLNGVYATGRDDEYDIKQTYNDLKHALAQRDQTNDNKNKNQVLSDKINLNQKNLKKSKENDKSLNSTENPVKRNLVINELPPGFEGFFMDK